MTERILFIKRDIAIFICLLLFKTAVFAQVKNNGIPFIKNFTQKDYKASPQNWSVVQDHRGVMYFGNNYGILEFDGNSWRLMGLPNKTIVRSLAIDKQGVIYIGGQDDFGYLTPDNGGQMKYVSLKQKIEKKYQNFDDVWKIYITNEGVLFCTFSINYYLVNDKIKVYQTDAQQSSFSFYVQERIFFPVSGKGIVELKNEKMNLIPNSEILAKYNIVGMLPYEENKVLIVTHEDGIFLYDGYGNFKPWNSPIEDFLRKSKINSVLALSEGYALGSAHDGLLIIDKNGVPQQHLNREKGLQNSDVQSIYQDYSGNIWLGLNNGIDYVEINSPFTLFNAKNGVPGTAYTSFIDNGKMYLGTNDGLYYKVWSANENPLQTSSFKLIEGTQGQVYKLQMVENMLLLSHHNGPYEIIDNKAYKISDHYGIWIFMPLQSHPGYILCGTYSGLLLYKLSNGKLIFQHKIKGFSESSRVMEQDDEGNIWIAHGYKGIFKIKLSPQLDTIENLDFYNEKSGFPSNLFINVFKINNKLVFTGERGTYRYNEIANRFESNEELDKIFDPNKHMRKLIEDKEGNIWFSMGDEMGVLKKRGNGSYDIEKKIFNKLEKKLVGGFEHIAYYNNHNVIIGTDEGFVHYDPSFLQNKNQERAFYTLIREVKTSANAKDSLIFGGTFSEKDLISAHQSQNEIPSISYAYNSLKFAYSAVSYEDIEKIEYQYLLEGFEKNWSSWTPILQKEYTNLREGDYVFHVKAKDIYNKESSESIYKFSIYPPWYRSVLAYIFYCLLGLMFLFILKKIFDRRVNQTQEKLRLEQAKAIQLKEAQHAEKVLHAEKEIIKLNNEKLENELTHKNKELASSAIHVMHSLETIEKVKDQLQDVIDHVRDKEVLQHLRKVLKAVEEDIKFENNWEQFEFHFNQIHQDFLKRLREDFPQLTHGDIKMCAYLRLNLASKEIAPLLNLSLRGIEASRYRIRKKMGLDQEVNLTDFLLKY